MLGFELLKIKSVVEDLRRIVENGTGRRFGNYGLKRGILVRCAPNEIVQVIHVCLMVFSVMIPYGY